MAKSKDEGQPRVKARVLVDGKYGRCNDVVEVDAGEQSPEIDATPEAVAYAESLKRANA